MIVELKTVLKGVQSSAGRAFSGLGIIVCDTPERIPLFPIRLSGHAATSDLVRALAQISISTSEYHDGFHVLSTTWELTRIAQYFSPPILTNIKVDRSKRFGGRYLAALFGSALPDVMMTGIVSPGFGVAIFQHGVEIFYEAAR